jgi:anti-sigma regulatory factor (Ser/Thr protein kinase)
MTAPGFCAQIDPTLGGNGLALTREQLRRWLQATGLPERARDEVLIAAGEACCNAVEHSGAQPGPDAQPAAIIRAICEPSRVRVVVTDRGRWKDPVAISGRGARGRGRMMMAGLVDDVMIRTGPTGTTVELTKVRP